MASALSQETVQKVYIAYYGRPADPAGLEYWADRLDKEEGNLDAIIDQFANSPESQDLYGGKTAEEMIDLIYDQMFGRAPDQAGKDFYVNALNDDKSGITLQSITLDILNGATGDDALIIANKLTVAQNFTSSLDASDPVDAKDEVAAYSGAPGISEGRALLDPVDASAASTSAALDEISNTIDRLAGRDEEEDIDQIFTLQASNIDNFTGGTGNDLFRGPDAGSLESADVIDGGDGDDVLDAQISSSAAPIVTNVEKIVNSSSSNSTLNMDLISGETEVWATNNDSGTHSFTNADIAGIQYVVADNTSMDINFANDTDLSGDSDTLMLASQNSTSTITSADESGIENITLNALSGGNTVDISNFSAINKLTLTGVGELDVTANTTALTEADATALSDDLTLDLSSSILDLTITGGSGDDKLTSGDGDDTVSGGEGDDTLQGKAGEDELNGDAGTDTLLGGDDNDILRGGEGNDNLDGEAGDDTIEGGAGDDEITGDAADVIDGGTGTDTLNILTTGATPTVTNVEKIVLGATSDTTLDMAGISGASEVWAMGNDSGTHSLTNAELTGITYNVAENTSLSIDFDEDLTGSSDNLMLAAHGTTSTISSADAAAIESISLEAVTGDNTIDISGFSAITGLTLNGEGNLDLTASNSAVTSVDGSALTGNLTLDLSGATQGITITAGTGADNITSGDGADSLTGGDGDDALTGNAGDDMLYGGDGVDTLAGGADNDTLQGDEGNDDLDGDAGDDTLVGGAGDDDLNGGADDDNLNGSLGNDTLTGGDGADEFRFDAGDGFDTVTDFVDGTDIIALQQNGTLTFANSTETGAGNDLHADDFVSVSDLFTTRTNPEDYDNKVVHLTVADNTDDIANNIGGSSAFYLVVQNSDEGHGQIWYDDDWSDAAGRQLMVDLTGVTATALTADDFGIF